MIFVELALQGVKGFPGVLRMPLKAGVNVARVPEPERRRALIDAIYHCMYADRVGHEAVAHLADPDASESRIALTFYGRDKITYRILRDLKGGAMKLYRFDAAAKKYRLFSSSASEVAQYVRVQQRLPDGVGYERLFIYAPEAMPSKGNGATTRSGVGLMTQAAAPSAPGLPPARFMSGAMARPSSAVGGMPNALAGTVEGFGPGGFNPTNALVKSEMEEEAALAASTDLPATVEEQQALLARLRGDLDRVTRANRAQGEIDQLNARKFEITERVAALGELESDLSHAKGRLAQEEDLSGLPPNLAERLRTFEEREERFRSEEAKLEDELIRIDREDEEDTVLPLQQDKYFVGSVGLGVLFFVLGATLARPFIALLNIPAALVAVGAGFRYVSDLERGGRRQSRRRSVEDRLDRLHKQHDLDTGVTRRLMRKLDVDSPSSLLERVESREAREQEVRELQTKLQQMRSSESVREDERELAEIQARLQVLEAEVLSASGAMHGAQTLRRRVEALQAALGSAAPSDLDSTPQGAITPIRVAATSDLTGSLVAESSFSGFVSPMSPLSTDDFQSPKTDDLPFQTRDLSGGRPPPGRGGSGIRAGSSSLPAFPGPAAPSQPPLTTTGKLQAQGPSGSEERTPVPGARVPAPRGGSTLPTPTGSSVSVATSLPPGVAPRRPKSEIAPRPTPSSETLPPFPAPSSAPSTPARTPANPIAPSGPGLPNPSSGPVVPPVADADRSVFDFNGGYLGGDDDEDDQGGSKGSGGEGGASTAGPGMWAIGYGGMAGGGFGGGSGGYGDGEAVIPDRSRELVQVAVDLLAVEVDELGNRFGPRLGQYLDAFTGGHFKGAELGARGEVGLKPAEGEPVLYRDLEGDLLDPVDAALRFALAESVLRSNRMPLLIDDPICELDGKRRKLFQQMLAYLAQATQVFVVTGAEDMQGHLLDTESKPA